MTSLIKAPWSKYVIRRLLKYSPEIKTSLEHRAFLKIGDHSSESFSLRRTWLDATIYHYKYANDAFYLYAYQYLKKNLGSISLNFLSKEEESSLEQIMVELNTFDRYMNLMDQLNLLICAFRICQSQNHVATAFSSVFSQEATVSTEILDEYKFLIEEYERIMSEMEGFPEWQKKLESECNDFIKWMYMFGYKDGKGIDVTGHFIKQNQFM